MVVKETFAFIDNHLTTDIWCFLSGKVKLWAVWTWGTSLHPIRGTVVRALTSWVLKAVTRRGTTRTAATPRTRSILLCRLLNPPLRHSGTSCQPSAYIAKMYVIHHVCICCISCQSYCLYIWTCIVYKNNLSGFWQFGVRFSPETQTNLPMGCVPLITSVQLPLVQGFETRNPLLDFYFNL